MSIAAEAAAGLPIPAPRFDYLMRLSAEFDAPQDVGETPLGRRRILLVRSGEFVGPALHGTLLPGGGDWVLVRRDGVAQLDIRFTLRTDAAELIYVHCTGLADIQPEVRRRIESGADVAPSGYYFRTALGFETAADRLLWLNRIIAVGLARRTALGMATDVFVLR
jgi:hypothetical protein